jgi:hypothetical protein
MTNWSLALHCLNLMVGCKASVIYVPATHSIYPVSPKSLKALYFLYHELDVCTHAFLLQGLRCQLIAFSSMVGLSECPSLFLESRVGLHISCQM